MTFEPGCITDYDWDRDYTVEPLQITGTFPPLTVWIVMGETNVPEDHWVESGHATEDAAERAADALKQKALGEGFNVFGDPPDDDDEEETPG
jgi:hypothetical protein